MQRKHISIYYLLSANHALDLLTINPEMQLTQFITLCVVSALAASCGHAAGIRVGRQSCTDVDNEQCQTNCAAQVGDKAGVMILCTRTSYYLN